MVRWGLKRKGVISCKEFSRAVSHILFNFDSNFVEFPHEVRSLHNLWECLYLKGLREGTCKSEVNMDGKFAGMEKSS